MAAPFSSHVILNGNRMSINKLLRLSSLPEKWLWTYSTRFEVQNWKFHSSIQEYIFVPSNNKSS